MKKLIAILALSTVLAGCTNQDAPATNQQVEEKTDEEDSQNETQVIEVKPQEGSENSENTENNENLDQNDEESNDKDSDEDEQTDEDQTSESEEADEENEEAAEASSEENPVEASDLFFLPYSTIVTINQDGKVVDDDQSPDPTNPTYHYEYVKYSNNIFVRSHNEDFSYSIVRMNDKDVTVLYDIPEGQEFRPLGLIGDKVYGYHSYFIYDEEKGHNVGQPEKNAIGVIDLASGESYDYEATVGVETGDASVIEGELQYKAPGDNYPENVYNYDLYKLDLAKGADQEPELLEKDIDLTYLFGQKRFIDGKADWNIVRADNEHIYADDKEFPFLWAEQGFQDFIGNNIFYFTSASEDGGEYVPFTTHLEVVNISSGETVLDEVIRGMKLENGKLFYINTDNEIKSMEIEL